MSLEVKKIFGVKEYCKNAKENNISLIETRKKTAKYRVELSDNQHPFLVLEEELSIDNLNLSSPKEIVNFLNEKLHLNRRGQEEVFLIGFNNQFEVNAVFKIGQGAINRCLISTRDIFIRAVLSGSKFIVIAHNHPSTTITPSQADYNICKVIKEAGLIMDIPLVDFLITGGENSYSFKANDEM